MAKDLKIEISAKPVSENIRSVILNIQNDLEEFMEVYDRRRIVMPLTNTIESITLASILTPYISRGVVDLLYIPRPSSKRILPKNLDTFLKNIGAKPTIISIEHTVKMLNTFLPRGVKTGLYEAITSIILRKYADNKNAILVKPYTYTHWVLGLFDNISLKTSDYLPFIRIYYSRLGKIAYIYRLNRFITKADMDSRIKRVLSDNKIVSVDILDRILDSIANTPFEIDYKELSRKYKVSEETVKKLLNMMRDSGFKKITPTPIP